MAKHAKLSPSGWKQWGTCPGSIGLIESLKIPNKSSKYAAEGTVGHEIHERCLNNNTNPGLYEGEKITADGLTFTVNKDMVKAVKTSIDYIRKRVFDAEGKGWRVEIIVERWVSLQYLGIKGLDGGTADVILIFYDDFDDIVEVEVVDYKHGAGVAVDPKENGQAMMYALGATHPYADIIDSDIPITITISQPRCFSVDGPIRSWVIPIENLFDWQDNELAPRAKATLQADAPLVPSTEGCRFCDAAKDCRKLYDLTVETAMLDFGEDERKPEKLTSEQKLSIVKNEEVIKQFFTAVINGIFDEVISGSTEYQDVFKLVRKKTNRKFTDDWYLTVEDHLNFDEMYIEKPKGLGEIERGLIGKLGKKGASDIMGSITYKPEGDLTLAAITDKRKSEQPPNPQNDFANVDDEDWD